MKYAREHVKKYHDFAYTRAMGTSMITFAIALSVGIIFTLLFNGIIGYNYGPYFWFWLLLVAITVFVLVVSFANAHMYSIRYMNKKERRQHSKYLGIWVLVLVVGALVFTLPALYLMPRIALSYNPSYSLMPLVFLFGFGGILWVIYLASAFIFESFYHEVAFGAVMLWIIFGLGVFNFGNILSSYFLANTSLVLAMSAISLILVFGFVGLMLLFSSSRILSSKIDEKE